VVFCRTVSVFVDVKVEVRVEVGRIVRIVDERVDL
jgi:hypothetical protein